MLSLRILNNTARGVSVLTTNQFGPPTGHNPVQASSIQTTNDRTAKGYRPLGLPGTRQFMTSEIDSQAVRIGRINKINDLLSDIESNLPEKPKKPITPWIMFVRERKDQILAQRSSKMSAPEISIILAKEWQQVDKSRYQQEYQRLHDEYDRQVEQYENSLSDEQRQLIKSQKKAKREVKAMRQLKKTNPPVSPRNPANLYCQERTQMEDIKELLKHRKAAQVLSDIFKEYRSLTDSQKQKYLDMQEEDKTRFQHEFMAWYEGVQNNENLSKEAREQAEAMRDRLKL